MDIEHLHIDRLKSGHTDSFEYLYNSWSGKLYNFVLRLSRGEEYLAEEIVQSVFIKIWENREQIDPDKSFGTFLYTIAKNQLVNIFQRRMLEYLHQEKSRDSLITSSNKTEQDVDYHLLDEFLNILIEQLPPSRREIFKLSRQQHLSNREIGEKLNISENTVESQLGKALSFLREKITKHYDIGLFLLAAFYLEFS